MGSEGDMGPDGVCGVRVGLWDLGRKKIKVLGHLQEVPTNKVTKAGRLA